MFSRYEKDKRPVWLRWFLFEVPSSATGDWWDKRDEMLFRRAPIRYALQHDLPIYFRRQVSRVRDQWWKVRHRTTDRMHIVNTRLKPGYHEINDRMLHAMFSLLCEYVEIGLASRNYESKTTNKAARGLEHLEWEITDPACQGHQADTAKIVKDLYLWWTVERPQRLETWSAPEIWGVREEETPERWAPFRRRRRPRLGMIGSKRRPKDEVDAGKMAGEVDEFYSAQDTDMMIRLAEIRPSLWT